MRRLLVLAFAGLVFAAAVAPVQAVTYSYCNSSLRGGGSLEPDNDIRATWDYLEESRGIDLTSSYAEGWLGDDGAFTVHARWIFWRANGDAVRGIYFSCTGSGSGYWDGRSL